MVLTQFDDLQKAQMRRVASVSSHTPPIREHRVLTVSICEWLSLANAEVRTALAAQAT